MSAGSDDSTDATTKAAGERGAASKRSAAARDKDRRGETRVRSRTLANGGVAGTAASKGGSFLATTVNLSIGGCLIRTYEALESGMEVTLDLKLPEGDVTAPGTVAHVNEDAVGCRMVGVKFGDLPREVQARLVEHIASFGVDPHARTGGAGRYAIEGRVHSD